MIHLINLCFSSATVSTWENSSVLTAVRHDSCQLVIINDSRYLKTIIHEAYLSIFYLCLTPTIFSRKYSAARLFLTLIIIIIMFLEQQISILLWFLKIICSNDAENTALITEINSLTHIHIENTYWNCKNISVFTVFLIKSMHPWWAEETLLPFIHNLFFIIFYHSIFFLLNLNLQQKSELCSLSHVMWLAVHLCMCLIDNQELRIEAWVDDQHQPDWIGLVLSA